MSSMSRTSAPRKRSRKALVVLVAHRPDEGGGELLDGRVADGQAVAVRLDVVADRVQEMGLPEAGLPVDEERVVGLGRHLGDGERGGVPEPVAVADDELVERVARVEAGRRPAVLDCGVAGCGGVPARCPSPSTTSTARMPSRRFCAAVASSGRKRSSTHVRMCSGARTKSVPPSSAAGSSGRSQMWKVTSVTSERSSRWTASQTGCKLVWGCGCERSAGTGLSAALRAAGRASDGGGERPRRSRRRASEGGSLTLDQGPDGRAAPFSGEAANRGKSLAARTSAPRTGGCKAVPILSISHEAHLPAEEAQARPHPRIPRPHAHARRARDAEAAARQGPQAAHAVAMDGPADAAAGGVPGASACPAAPSSTASIARAARTRTATSSSTRSRARATTADAAPRASRSGARLAAPSSETE